MVPVLQVGPLALPVPGLTLLIGVWIGLWLAEREAVRLRLDPGAVYNLAFIGLFAGLIGARLAYVARYWSAYVSDPLSVFSLNPATLAPTEGALLGIVAAALYGARRKPPLRLTLDALAPAVAVMGVAIAMAHLASGDASGAAARVFLEAFRGDSLLILGGCRAAQAVSPRRARSRGPNGVWGLATLALCLGLMKFWRQEAAA
jgi:phosphatidylglycerol:prolipoprotein diacylglycerol transferase